MLPWKQLDMKNHERELLVISLNTSQKINVVNEGFVHMIHLLDLKVPELEPDVVIVASVYA